MLAAGPGSPSLLLSLPTLSPKVCRLPAAGRVAATFAGDAGRMSPLLSNLQDAQEHSWWALVYSTSDALLTRYEAPVQRALSFGDKMQAHGCVGNQPCAGELRASLARNAGAGPCSLHARSAPAAATVAAGPRLERAAGTLLLRRRRCLGGGRQAAAPAGRNGPCC